MKYKKALVTGGAGFIGSYITEYLIDEGLEVIVLDNLQTGKKRNTPAKASFIKGDIKDLTTLNKAMQFVDVVFHEAATVSIRNSINNYVNDAENNILGTLNIIKAAANNNVKRIIYASSMAVYGTSKYLPIDEAHSLDPKSPYGISKLAGEKYLQIICESHGIEYFILRYFNTFGARQTYTPYVGVLTIFITNLLKKECIKIIGDGSQLRDYIAVEDVAIANILAMNSPMKNMIVNIGSGRGTTVNEIVSILIDEMGINPEVIYLPKLEQEPQDSISNSTLAQKILGFSPSRTIKSEVRRIIEWNYNELNLLNEN